MSSPAARPSGGGPRADAAVARDSSRFTSIDDGLRDKTRRDIESWDVEPFYNKFVPKVVTALPETAEVRALAALAAEGGHDLQLAMLLAEAVGFGWGAAAEDLRRANALLSRDATLPSLLLSTLRDHLRTELVLANYRLVPLHAYFIADTLSTAGRLARLVLHFNAFGDAATARLAAALRTNASLTTIHLVACEVGDAGAAALAEMLAVNRTLDDVNLDSNAIGTRGALALAGALAGPNRALTELRLSHNRVGPAGVAALTKVFSAAPRRMAYVSLASQFQIDEPLVESAECGLHSVSDIVAQAAGRASRQASDRVARASQQAADRAAQENAPRSGRRGKRR
jgi:hypothetical protein